MAAVFAEPGAQRLLIEGERDGRMLRGVRSLAIGGDAAVLSVPAPPPHLNQHAAQILGELLGHDAAAIAALAAAGAFGAQPV